MTRYATVGGLRDYRQPRRDAGNIELCAGFADQRLVYARWRAGLKDSIRRTANAFPRPGDADKTFDLVVVRRKVFVCDGPVRAHAVARVRFEIVVGEAQ